VSQPRIEACQGKALAFLAVVFLLGAGSGAVGHWAATRGAVEDGLDFETSEVFGIERLRLELDLSDDQVVRVQTIIDQSIMTEADLMNQIRDARLEGKRELVDILSEKQQNRFEEMLQKQRASSH
jgi:hypothetical protein